ncbi:MAG: hypothetical protein REI09_12305, partial [Candidatus Dactylopiibacterium sp.]|nr:hypothetical protein [Candidatus Dactylopiibacterium sp.]
IHFEKILLLTTATFRGDYHPQRQRAALAQGFVTGRPVGGAVLRLRRPAHPASLSATCCVAGDLCNKASLFIKTGCPIKQAPAVGLVLLVVI